MRRTWILVAAGSFLVATATILGLILFRKHGFFELTLPELTIWSIVVGTMTAAFLGLLFVQMRGPTAEGRTRSFLFGLFGAICGLVAGTVYGVLTIEEVCLAGGIDLGPCGWSVLGMMLASPWISLALLAAIGVVLGAVTGVSVARLTRGSRAPIPTMAEP